MTFNPIYSAGVTIMNATQDRWYNRSIFNLLLILLFVLIPATTRADIQCYQCHGTSTGSDYRPIDAASRNYSTGGFTGNHRSHMAAPANPITCRKCHNNQDYTANHRNDFINFSSNINSSPTRGKYIIGGSQVTSKAQSATPVLGTCADVNCHFEAVTPQWGTELFTAPTDCDKCHGAPPSGGSTGASGSHAKHDQYYSGVANCQKCHSNNTSFQHATSAGRRNLNISFAAAPNNGGGAYSGTLNDYLPSQNPTGTGGFGNCTATYCHSPGNKASGFDPPGVVPTWGGAALTCKNCHKSDFASGTAMSSGSHTGHINKFGWGANTTRCVKCHAVTAKSDMTISNITRHVNAQVEIAFDSTSSAANGTYKGTLATPASPMTKVPGSATGQCANIYCHSTGQGDNASWPPTYSTTPAWGTSDMQFCGKCHSTQYAHGGSFGIATPLTTGSHAKHLKYRYVLGMSEYEKCVVCHAYQRVGTTPGSCVGCHSMTALKHANYEINVGIPDYYGALAKYDKATTKPGAGYYSTCSNVYCHSDGLATPVSYSTPTWGNPASGACGTCHGAKADSPPASARHAKHVGVGPYSYACALCHVGIVKHNANSATYTLISTSTDFTFVNGSVLHVNKTRDVRFDLAINPFGHYSSANQTCITAYCHSIGNTSIASGRLPAVYNGKIYARPKWTDVGPLACNACHGRSTSNGMPDYANGKMGSMSSNSHPKHVTSSAIACVECHEKTTKTGTTIRNTFPGKHVNGTNHDVYFNLSGLSPSGTYDNTQRKCSTTYCHGTGASLAWGGTTYCNSCHSANAGTTGGGEIHNWGATPISAHKLHWEDTTSLPSKYSNYSAGNLGSADTYRFGCASCHNPASTAHVNGYASGSYRAQVFFGYTAPGKKPAYTYTGTTGTADNGFAWSNGNSVCNSTYCHSDGNGGAGTAVSWATTANSATATRCKLCHAYTTASGTLINTYKHAKHVNGTTYSFSCAKCHNLTTTDGSAIADKTRHVNKKKDVAWDTTNSDGSAYVNTATACANIYCHSQGTTFAQPYTGAGKAPRIAVTWGGGQTLSCNSCHGNANGYTVGIYRVAAPLYASGAPKGNAHQLHVDARLGADAGAQCLNCHNATTTNNTSIATYSNHVNEAYTIGAGGTYRDGDDTTTIIGVTTTYAYNPAGSSCSNVSCHPTGLNKVDKLNTVATWKTGYQCSDCHDIDLQASDTYHHAMRNYSTSEIGGYPTTIPDGQATNGTNSASRRCTMCHVDHTIFSPTINSNAALTAPRAMNLRSAIGVQPDPANNATYANSDYLAAGGGICISCHATARTKSTEYKKDQAASNVTPVVTAATYSVSAHQYSVNSTITNGGATFSANCAKCHNTKSGESTTFQNSTNKFGVHKGTIARMQAPLGIASPDEFEEESFCYRCHSKSTDTNPGGAPAKSLSDKDYYGGKSMSVKSQGIFAAMQKGAPITTNTNVLFLRSTATSEPAPNATASTDTFQGGTWQGREMLTTQGSSAATQAVTINNTGNPRYWRMTSFVSPPVASGATINAGNWTLRLWALENNTGANAYMRATIYVWTAADAKGTVILAPTSYSTELTTTSTAYSWTVAGGAATLNTGDRIVVELEIDSRTPTATTYTATYRWNGAGSTDDSKITMPQTISFTTGTSGGVSHPVGSYSAKHLPSSADETQAYLAANRHVECNDCHNPHQATNTNAIQGVTGLTPNTPTAGSTPTYTFTTVNNADDQYKICFKCHTDWAGYGTGTQNLAVAFNTSNDSFHWVETDRGAAKASTSYGTFNHTTVPTKTYTYVDAMMPRHSALADAALRSAKMRCSDCHGSESADGGVAIPEGPHGSALASLLKVPAGSAYNTWNSTVKFGDTNIWCFNCHSPAFTTTGFSSGGSNLHGTKHNSFACQYCHLAIPHGPTEVGTANQRKRLLKPTVFTESIDSLNSGSMGQSPGHSATIPGCT